MILAKPAGMTGPTPGYATGMATVVERERKYEAPDDFRLPDIAGVGPVDSASEPVEHRLRAVYHDTADLRLVRSGMALRRRTGGTDAGWHLKIGAAGGDRTEQQRPDAEEPPGDLLTTVRSATRGQVVEPAAQVVTRRQERELRAADGRVLATVAEDAVEGHDLASGARTRWREVEVELTDDADDAVLAAVDRRLRKAGARPAARSKVQRVLGERLGTFPAPADEVSAYALDQRDALLAAEPAAREGDADAVHDMRVAVRRLRSTLRTFRNAWGRRAVTPVRDELHWLGGRLGGVRDPQVMADRLDKAFRAEPPDLVLGPVLARTQQRFAADVAAGVARLGKTFDSRRYLRLLASLDALLERGPARKVKRRWVHRRIARDLRRADRMLDRALETGRDTDLHEARKAYKRARYAAEVRRPAVGGPARRRVKELKGMQDLLGDHQDATVTREVLRRHALRAYGDRENTFTYGVVYGRQVTAADRTRERVPAAVRRVRRRKLRRWL
jgi:CHAD domain-containing protein